MPLNVVGIGCVGENDDLNKDAVVSHQLYSISTTITVLWHSVRDYAGELVPEENCIVQRQNLYRTLVESLGSDTPESFLSKVAFSKVTSERNLQE